MTRTELALLILLIMWQIGKHFDRKQLQKDVEEIVEKALAKQLERFKEELEQEREMR